MRLDPPAVVVYHPFMPYLAAAMSGVFAAMAVMVLHDSSEKAAALLPLFGTAMFAWATLTFSFTVEVREDSVRVKRWFSSWHKYSIEAVTATVEISKNQGRQTIKLAFPGGRTIGVFETAYRFGDLLSLIDANGHLSLPRFE